MLSALVLYGIAASSGAAFAAPALQTRQNNGWPEFDAVPSTDSDWARHWAGLVDFSAVPAIPATVERTCNAATDPFNVERAADNCYWTCNQCIREQDVSICPTKGDWGLTFDDGPTPETAELLDNLATDGTKATFFVIGSQALRHPGLVARIVEEGHQIAIHTWSHEPLTSLTNEQIVVELEWTRQIIIAIVGAETPITMMRPPYGDIDDRVRAISQQMGIVPAMWTLGFDTNDWKLVETPEARGQLDGEFETLLNAGRASETGFISLQHDSGAPTVRYAIDVILPRARSEGWNLLSLAQCGAV